jgi:hypothetical protein
MSTPKDCMSCEFQYRCNSAMYSKGCGFYPPKKKNEKKTSIIAQFFGKFSK